MVKLRAKHSLIVINLFMEPEHQGSAIFEYPKSRNQIQTTRFDWTERGNQFVA